VRLRPLAATLGACPGAATHDAGMPAAKRSRLRLLLLTAPLAYAATWVDFALAAPIAVPVDGVAASGVPNGFLGPAHEGVDIFARKGTKVRAVSPGIVVRKETQPRGGNVVFVLGTDAVLYFYAHLDRWEPGIEPGAVVTPGAVLGTVGDTGNAKGRAPHLHFEARVLATAFAPVDPKLLFQREHPARRVRAAWKEIGDPR
jgi:murein DD-endopeptidase MepM/ murein hydrolase activator NlpD